MTMTSSATTSDKPKLWVSFGRAQISSLIATLVDLGTLFASVELFGLWYVAGTALGAFLGAVTNFLLGRHWSFEAAEKPVPGQALRYALVSGGSLLLNSAGVFAFTEGFGLKYGYSKAVVAILVGVLFNFPLHRRYVFK